MHDDHPRWLFEESTHAGVQVADETVVHVRDDFSTWDWVMSGMLERAGFRVETSPGVMLQMRVYLWHKGEGH